MTSEHVLDVTVTAVLVLVFLVGIYKLLCKDIAVKAAEVEMKRQIGLALKDKIELRVSTEDLKGIFK